MAGKDEETMGSQMEQVPSDPWAVAFAAINKEEEDAVETDAGSPGAGEGAGAGDDVPDTKDDDQGEGPAEDEAGHGSVTEDLPGGPGDLGGAADQEDEDLGWLGVDLSEEEIGRYRESFTAGIRERVLNDVSAAYIKQGARNQNGKLGATINDPDVCKRDSDGVPRFFNPETGREFTGDNPRRQAQEWVDDYNRELSEAFNKTCHQYEKQLIEKEGGRLAIIEFAPKYKALDPVRRSMFESIIEDYEVTDDDGNIVAYSCNLDKALAAVNRQVKVIQQRFSKQGGTSKATPAEPSGPALDTPSVGSSQADVGKPQFKSLAEAMEWEQDQLLARRRNKQ